MEVLNRLNAFLGIMFVALLLEAVFFSFTDGSDTVGHAFKIEGREGDIEEGYETKITKEMKDLISKAREKYLENDIPGTTEVFNELMILRVKVGGKFPIDKFTELSPGLNNLIIKEDKNGEAGFIMLDGSNGKVIADEVEEISRVIRNYDSFSKTMHYIFNQNYLSAIVVPNRLKTIKFNDKFYYYERDSKGELNVRKRQLFWFNLEVKDKNLVKAIMTKKVNSMIDAGEFTVLLDKRYTFEVEKRRSVLGKAISFMEEVSFV